MCTVATVVQKKLTLLFSSLLLFFSQLGLDRRETG